MFKNKFNKSDYLPSDLPRTRRAQFKDIIFSNFGMFLLIGLCLLVFALLYFAISIFGTYFLGYIKSSMEAKGSSEVAISDSIKLYKNLIRVIRILAFVVFAIGLSGVGRIVRELGFSNGVLFKQDFFRGIKQNIKNYVIIAVLLGLLLFLIELFQDILLNNIAKAPALILSGIAFGILFIVILPINMYMLSSSTIYDMGFIPNFINCSKLYIKNLFWSILFSLLPIGIKFLDFIPYLYIRLTIIAIIIFILLPIYIMIWHLFCLSNFDKYFNEKYYPEIYKKGLYLEDKKEEPLL